MTKTRRKFLLIVTIFIGLLIWLNNFYQSPAVQERITGFIEKSVADAGAGTLSINKITLGFFAVNINGITYKLPDSKGEVYINSARVGISLSAIAEEGWKPLDLLQKLLLSDLEVSIVVPLDAPSKEKFIAPTPEEIYTLIAPIVPLEQLKLKNGSFKLFLKRESIIDTVVSVKDIYITAFKREKEISLTVKGVLTDGDSGELVGETTVRAKANESSANLKLTDIITKRNLNTVGVSYSANIDGDITFGFVNRKFPMALVPTGQLKLSNVETGIKQKNVFITKGKLKLFADSGIVNSNLISVEINRAPLKFKVATDLLDNGKSIIDGFYDDKYVSIEAQAKIDSFTAPTYKVEANGIVKNTIIEYALSGVGDYSKIDVDTLSYTYPTGKGSGSGVFNYSGSYRAKSNAKSKIRIDSITTISAEANLSVNGIVTTPIPNVDADIYNFYIKRDLDSIDLPKSKAIMNQKGSIDIISNDNRLSYFIKLTDVLDPKLPYKGASSFSEEYINIATELFGLKNRIVHSARINLNFLGDRDWINSNFIVGVLNRKWGFIDSKIEFKWNRKYGIKVDARESYWENYIRIPFSFTLLQGKDKWDFYSNIDSGVVKNITTISSDFKNIISSKTSIDSLFIPRLISIFTEYKPPINSGYINSKLFVNGAVDSIKSNIEVEINEFSILGSDSINTFFNGSYSEGELQIKPFDIKRVNRTIIAIDKSNISKDIDVQGNITSFPIHSLKKIFENTGIRGLVSGDFSINSYDKLKFNAKMISANIGKLRVRNVKASGSVTSKIINIDSCSLYHTNLKLFGDLSIPTKSDFYDTLSFDLGVKGDLLEALGSMKYSTISGHGDITGGISGGVTEGDLFFNKDSRVIISGGELEVHPFIRGSLDSLYLDLSIYRTDSVSLYLAGQIDNKKLVIKNDYNNFQHLKPFKFGKFNVGLLRIFTDKGGVPIFIPGFLENRVDNSAYVETAGKDSIPAFTLSGPLNKFGVTGTILLRKTELTFPLLKDVEYRGSGEGEPIFPFITFDMDIIPADRTVRYFYQLGDKKRRRMIRIIEATLDPSVGIGVRGRAKDNTFRMVGGIRSYQGYLFYGQMFDRNFEMGIDFQPEKLRNGSYSNLPIVWGSAEAMSDTVTFQKSTVTLMTVDTSNGLLRTKGRFTKLVIVPSNENLVDGTSELAEDERSANFYRDAGDNIGDGDQVVGLLTGVGDRYISGNLFGYWTTRISRKIGLDRLRLETSVVSNSVYYLSQKEVDTTKSQNFTQLALANTGLTIGKYLYGQPVMAKFRVELTPEDTLIIPRYQIGLEYQPFRWLWIDASYGIEHNYDKDTFISNPKIEAQIRVPFNDIVKFWKKQVIEFEKVAR